MPDQDKIIPSNKSNALSELDNQLNQIKRTFALPEREFYSWDEVKKLFSSIDRLSLVHPIGELFNKNQSGYTKKPDYDALFHCYLLWSLEKSKLISNATTQINNGEKLFVSKRVIYIINNSAGIPSFRKISSPEDYLHKNYARLFAFCSIFAIVKLFGSVGKCGKILSYNLRKKETFKKLITTVDDCLSLAEIYTAAQMQIFLNELNGALFGELLNCIIEQDNVNWFDKLLSVEGSNNINDNLDVILDKAQRKNSSQISTLLTSLEDEKPSVRMF